LSLSIHLLPKTTVVNVVPDGISDLDRHHVEKFITKSCWIPIHKMGGTVCNNCRKVISKNHVDDLECERCKSLPENEVIYMNRDSDAIHFKDDVVNKIVEMTGYGPYYRIGLQNDYSYAYTEYCKDNPLPQLAFSKFIPLLFEEEYLKPYRQYIKSTDKIEFFDPSGGPYINVGEELGYYFGDGKSRIVKEIQKLDNSVIFKY
jgi:hypothetical protein